MRLSALDKDTLIKIIKSQKKIVIAALVVLATFLCFLVFVYLPSKNTVKAIKKELAGIERQIREIEGRINGEDKLSYVNIEALKNKASRLTNKFPSKEEESIKMLYDFARKSNIEIISLKPQPKTTFFSADNKEVSSDGKVLQTSYVFLQMKCLYKDLADYLTNLEKDLPAFMSVEKISISKDNYEVLRLNVELYLNLYLLS